MNKNSWSIVFLILLLGGCSKDTLNQTYTVTSPDKSLECIIGQNTTSNNSFHYTIVKNTVDTILSSSQLGVCFENSSLIQASSEVVSTNRSSKDTTWTTTLGENKSIRDHYQQLTLNFCNKDNKKFSILVRMYNQGVALKYIFPQYKDQALRKEETSFCFPKNHATWIATQTQGKYYKGDLNNTPQNTQMPYTIEADHYAISIGEAQREEYATATLYTSGKNQLSLATQGEIKASETPWRYIHIANTPAKLLETNQLILNLSKPCQIKNTEWIKGGTVLREITLTTQGAKATIDFARKHHIKYVEFDAGWYGPENDPSSDATTVTVDPQRSKGPLNLEEIVRYAKAKNIGILLYVNHLALEKQAHKLFPLFESWGIAGVKFGFVKTGTQKQNRRIAQWVIDAAKHHLLVDIHDEYRPSGYSRTYPNLLTQEGIRGDEESIPLSQSLATLFTRMLAGAADNTNCLFDPRVQKMGSKVTQMAKAIAIYSPLQFIYWYDRPIEAFKNQIEKNGSVIDESEDLSFYDSLPTTWDSTKVLEGTIGERAIIARKKGDTWYLAALSIEGKIDLPKFDFLSPNKTYTAHIYTDNYIHNNNRIKQETQKINANNTIKIHSNLNACVIRFEEI